MHRRSSGYSVIRLIVHLSAQFQLFRVESRVTGYKVMHYPAPHDRCRAPSLQVISNAVRVRGAVGPITSIGVGSRKAIRLGRVLIKLQTRSMYGLAHFADSGRTSPEVREGPCVDGSELARGIFTSQSWSVQPCVRPLSAVHMTAGHNALRGSGPGHKPAFENALALVGCPDRRIDRLCITCCSPSQPSHHAVVRGAISSDPQRGWIIVSLAPSHHGPGHSGELVG